MLSLKDRKFWIILGGFLALGFAVFLDFQSEKSGEKTRTEGLRILNQGSADQVAEIEIQKAASKIKLKKSLDGWQIVSPIATPGDNQFIDLLIEESFKENALEIAASGADLDLKVFGLDQPFGMISYKLNSGASVVIEVSDKQNFERNSILKRQGDSVVYIAPNAWHRRVQKGLYELRDKRVFRHAIGSIHEVEVQGSYETVKILRVENQWTVPKLPDLKVDLSRTLEFLNQLVNSQFTDFVDELAFQKMNKESLKIALSVKIKDLPWKLEVYRAKDGALWGGVASEKLYGKLEPGFVQNLSLFGAHKLRNLREPFVFETVPVVKASGVVNGQTWELSESTDTKVKELLAALVKKVSDSRAAEYFESQDRPPKNKDLKNRMQFFNDKKEVLFTLEWGAVVNGKIQAISSQSKFGFYIDQSFLDRFSFKDLVPQVEKKDAL